MGCQRVPHAWAEQGRDTAAPRGERHVRAIRAGEGGAGVWSLWRPDKELRRGMGPPMIRAGLTFLP